jgi:hypothetical protein
MLKAFDGTHANCTQEKINQVYLSLQSAKVNVIEIWLDIGHLFLLENRFLWYYLALTIGFIGVGGFVGLSKRNRVGFYVLVNFVVFV